MAGGRLGRVPTWMGGPRSRRVTAAEVEEWKRLRARELSYDSIGQAVGRAASVIYLRLDPVARQRADDYIWCYQYASRAAVARRLRVGTRYRAEQAAAGLCVKCCRPRVTAQHCEDHRQKQNRYNQIAYRRRHGA